MCWTHKKSVAPLWPLGSHSSRSQPQRAGSMSCTLRPIRCNPTSPGYKKHDFLNALMCFSWKGDREAKKEKERNGWCDCGQAEVQPKRDNNETSLAKSLSLSMAKSASLLGEVVGAILHALHVLQQYVGYLACARGCDWVWLLLGILLKSQFSECCWMLVPGSSWIWAWVSSSTSSWKWSRRAITWPNQQAWAHFFCWVDWNLQVRYTFE